MSCLANTIAAVLVVALSGFAGLKFFSGYDHRIDLPEWLYWTSATIEMGIALGIAWPRTRLLALRSTAGFALVGLAFSYSRSDSSDCGCLGIVASIDVATQRTVLAVIGLAAVALLCLGCGSRIEPREPQIASRL